MSLNNSVILRKIAIISNHQSQNAYQKSKINHSIISFFQENNIETILYHSRTLDDLSKIIRECIARSVFEFVAIGGDGTLHYLINELIAQNYLSDAIRVALIPKGTGNDWKRNFPHQSLENQLKNVLEYKIQKVDIGRIEFYNHPIRYFVNIAGLGFNGVVIQRVEKYKYLRGMAYYMALIASFFRYQPMPITIEVNGKVYRRNTFILTVGIGKYAGNAMLLCPHANISDGLLEINLIASVPKFKFLTNLFRLRDGSYLDHLEVISLRSDSVRIIENNSLLGEADGEYIGNGIQSISSHNQSIWVFS